MAKAHSERRKEDLIVKWLDAHEAQDRLMHTEFKTTLGEAVEQMKGLRDDIKPILQIYQTTNMGGRWIMKITMFIGAILAVILGVIKLKTGTP